MELLIVQDLTLFFHFVRYRLLVYEGVAKGFTCESGATSPSQGANG